MNFTGNNQKLDAFSPEVHQARMSEVTVKNTLTEHERGLHSSILNDYLLSQSGQALSMPKFLKLKVDFTIYHAYKINKTISYLGRSSKTKIAQ